MECKNGCDNLKIEYNLSQELIDKISIESEFIFISRSIINETLQEYWPSQDTGVRYFAYKFSAIDWAKPTGTMIIAERVNDVIDDVYGSNFRIGTESEVYNSQKWS